MENDSWDESQSDSGVSADFSPGSTMEGNPASISSETPIEREIRLSVERENNLRKSRGLPSATSNSQYVQIPLRKAVLTQSNTGKVDKNQDKDREFTGKVMRQEIYEETQREQDLVKLGKIPGIYDKGTVRQMKERKQIFEKTASLASTIKGSYPERDRSFDATSPTQSSNAAKAGGSTNSTVREEEEEEEELTPQDNPFFKLRSSTSVVKVQQDIQETHEREKELRKQRRSLYGDRGGAKGGEGGGGRSDSTDGRSLALSPSLNGLTAPDLSGSSSREETGLSAGW
uniref:Uncharacterized protein n=1 Tax=Salarias fasciatus TaxID=181472 RepID=A0A672GE01_SALFA